jgi:hypothetical protein
VVPAGYTIGLHLLGRDFDHGLSPASLSNVKHPMRGCGPFLHEDDIDRPPSIFHNKVTVHFEPKALPYLLLPIVPSR